MRLLCDEMLARLGRWLRAAGYDTRLADEMTDDTTLLRAAEVEDRLLITCDRVLAERAAPRAVLLQSAPLADQAEALRKRLGVDWLHAPFTRCVVDNAPLEPATPRELEALPPQARGLGGPLRCCPACGRLYWQGSHYRRMARRLAAWQGAED